MKGRLTMKHRFTIIVLMLSLFVLPSVAQAFPLDRYRFETVTVTYTQAEPALVNAYWPSTSGSGSRYMPRQWQAGTVVADLTWGDYQVVIPGVGVGCDVWNSVNSGSLRAKTNEDFHRIRLNRDATVHVIWRDIAANKPSWINSTYTAGAGVQVKRLSNGATANWLSFSKSVPAGDALFGASWSLGATPVGGRNLPWFVICEANGSPSPAPVVPDSIGPEETPLPNQACPEWVHDLHQVTVEGIAYRTWHPQIDPVYWCYYQHEHGSDPQAYDDSWIPLFGDVATIHGMTENHWGYKFTVFDRGDFRYGIMVHQGTTGVARACQQFHEVQFRAKRISTGVEVFNLKWIGNFGAAVENDTLIRLTPDACPDQGTSHIGNGTRMIPVVNGGGAPGATLYEPWRLGGTYLVNGVTSNFVQNTPSSQTACYDRTCNVGVDMDKSGSVRFLTLNEFGVTWNMNHGADGRFCTDPLGEVILTCTDHMAIPQYIEPGFAFQFGPTQHISDVNGWGLPFQFNANTGFDSERENSIPPGANN